MHDSECIVSIGAHSGCKPTTLGVVHNEDCDISAVEVAQAMDFFHVAVPLVGEPPDMIEVRALLRIIRLVDMHETQRDVTKIAQAEGLVCFLDGEVDELAFDVAVLPSCLLRVCDDDVNDDVLRCCARLIRDDLSRNRRTGSRRSKLQVLCLRMRFCCGPHASGYGPQSILFFAENRGAVVNVWIHWTGTMPLRRLVLGLYDDCARLLDHVSDRMID